MQTLHCALLAFISLTSAQYFFPPPYPAVFVYHPPAPLPVRYVREPYHEEDVGVFRAKPNKIPDVPILGMDGTTQRAPVRTTKKPKTTKQPTTSTSTPIVMVQTTTVQPKPPEQHVNILNAEQPVNATTVEQPVNASSVGPPVNASIEKQPGNALTVEQPDSSVPSTQQPTEQPTQNSTNINTQEPSTEQPSVPFAPLLPYEEEDFSKNNATGTAPDSMGGVVFAAFSVPSRRPAGGISFG